MVDKNEEAAKLLKKGLKFLSPSILEMRLKPDWEAAAPLLDRAALLFKVGEAHMPLLAIASNEHLTIEAMKDINSINAIIEASKP